MFRGIDLFSDTVTRPTPQMRQAMADAEVGDEQLGEDPSTNRLQERIAGLIGKTAALFVPTATLANQIATMLHCERGDELLVAEQAHFLFAEGGGAAMHAGALTRPISTPDGVFSAADVLKYFRRSDVPNFPSTALVIVENTTNLGGGVAWPKDALADVVNTARELNLRAHLDGARLFNASIATGTPPKQLAAGFDTVTLCMSKGLGCPSGALLVLDEALLRRARRLKAQMGGALRQSGILAAAALYALDNHVSRLAEDHENARLLAQGLADVPGVRLENPIPSTNMVFFNWQHPRISPAQFSQRCIEEGLRFSPAGPTRFRAVIHLDVSRVDIARAIEIARKVVGHEAA
jgi:threonine aldolase